MHAIRNIQSRELITDRNGDPDLFACAEDAQAELKLFESVIGSEQIFEVVDLGCEVEPESLTDFEVKIAEAIGKRL